MDTKNAKKRGRKPKGGKIIDPVSDAESTDRCVVQNIILHLKCNSKDLNFIAPTPEQVEPYSTDITFADVPSVSSGDNLQVRLKELVAHVRFNDSMKRSACFWCTCPFDTVPIHIPRSVSPSGQYQVYGCFCSPECAAASLFREQLDQSVCVERYHLLNFLYGKLYNYTNNITPAPPPYYLLSKFYGTLSIEEYRSMLKTVSIVVLDKPISLQYPEIGVSFNTPNTGLDTTNKPENNTPGYRLCRRRKQ